MTEEAQQIESIGGRLHRARLKKKATIDQVYKEIKVHPKILTALEEDRYEEFLSPTYIKAFLKSYCRYLELDANRILADYDSLRKPSPRASLDIRYEEKDIFNWKAYARLGKKWVLPIAGGILVVFLSVSIISLSLRAIRNVKAGRLFKREASIVKEVREEEEPKIVKPLSIPEGQPLTLIVKTKGDVWLEVKSDGKTAFKSILKKGSVEAYKANERFQLWTGKGEFLDIVLNGNPLGSPGNGVIRKIVLTREGLKIDKK